MYYVIGKQWGLSTLTGRSILSRQPEIVFVLIFRLAELHDRNLYKTLKFGLIQESMSAIQ